MNKCIASFFALLLLVAPVSANTTVGQRFIEAFASTCISQVKTGVVSGNPGYDPFTPKQRLSLATSFGTPENPPDAAWADPSANWFQLQQDLDVPELCQFVSLRADPHIVASEWKAKFSDAFRYERPANVRATRSGIRGGGFYSRPSGDGFLQLAFTPFSVDETVIVVLTALQIGQTPASCELWPEECK